MRGLLLEEGRTAGDVLFFWERVFVPGLQGS
jgi:hypothetical protein